MNILIIENQTGLFNLNSDQEHKIRKIDPRANIVVSNLMEPGFDTHLEKADIIITQANEVANLSGAKNLKWIHLTSAGANSLPKQVAKSDILVTNSSGVHPIPISEHVMGLMLTLIRGINKSYRNQALGKGWVRDIDYFSPQELSGKQLLIVGMGRLGERIAKLGLAFEMKVSGIVRDKQKHLLVDDVKIYEADSLDNLLNKADIVVNCLPSTPETYHLFDKEKLKQFKKGSMYINIGRGDTTVEEDLITALQSGQIGSAGLDVFEEEPLPLSSPLWQMQNVVITPHYSGANPFYTDRVMEIFSEDLKAYLDKKPMPNLVNKKLEY